MKSSDYYGAVSSGAALADASVVPPPTAPPMEHQREIVTHVQGGDAVYPPQLHQGQQPSQVQPQPPPPPPYNEAINYPPLSAAPPYPAYQPNTFQNVSAIAQVTPHMPQMSNNSNGTPIYVMPSAPIPTIVNTTTIVPTEVRQSPIRANPCAHCTHGVVQSEADYCCLFCLLFFAVISFPFGLVLLLFIPLAFRRRCSACRHLYT